ncbi:MAG: hypothetical protein F4Z69_08025 [Bacteroidetes bacterium SB0668_bin_1]|nr:hypothetical protein [Bacteroidetes bacterium SB0668_bin_1]
MSADPDEQGAGLEALRKDLAKLTEEHERQAAHMAAMYRSTGARAGFLEHRLTHIEQRLQALEMAVFGPKP